jgi:hypothetical protein
MTEEAKVPNFLQNRIDLKAMTIRTFGVTIDTFRNLPDRPYGDLNSIVMTNFGLIEGEIIDLSDEGDERVLPFKSLAVAMFDARNNVLTERESLIGEENIRVVNDSSMFLVVNATLIPFSNPQNRFNIGEILLFTDQVVGLTAGNQTLKTS